MMFNFEEAIHLMRWMNDTLARIENLETLTKILADETEELYKLVSESE